MRDWLCKLLCGKWCNIQITETWKKAWKIVYDIGYEDGKAGREPMPPPPTKVIGLLDISKDSK